MWLAGKKDSKWWAEGGSNRFYRYCVRFQIVAPPPPPPTHTHRNGNRMLIILIPILILSMQGVHASLLQEEFWHPSANGCLRKGGKDIGQF